MTQSRLVYDDADTTHEMAENASACRAEAHIGKALRRIENAPGQLLGAPRQLTKTAVNVSEAAARFAAKLFD